jgi:hypothetical protein
LLQTTLTQSQDKALRRIGELKEQSQLDYQAKKDLENNYQLMLDEKDEVIMVLRTQVAQTVTRIVIVLLKFILQ